MTHVANATQGVPRGPLTCCPWLCGNHDEVVARSAHRARTRSELLSEVAGWAALSLPPDRDVALFEPDPWRFTTALLGLWHRGHRVWLAGDDLPDTVAWLRAHDLTLLGTLSDAPLVPPLGDPALLSADQLSPEREAVVLFTSGSSGTPAPVTKTLAQLDAEVAAFARHWPLGEGAIISQVSHQHTWGLTAGLLRALGESRPFGLEMATWPETLAELLTAMPVSALISSPPQLSRLPGSSMGIPDKGPGRIFSAAAPLAGDAAAQAEALLHSELIEIYGSSESGAIAWRRPCKGTIWQALDDVTLTCQDGQTLLRSPRLPQPDQWVEQADHISISDTSPIRFSLHGRVDRIVKIAGKRVSLDGLARQIEAFPGVRQASCLTIDHSGGRIGAVVALEETVIAHEHETRRALIGALRAHLASAFEQVVLPRFWRFVADFPVNTQGKFTHTMARQLFNDLDDRRQPRWLEVHQTTPARCELVFEIPERLAALEGHFPGRPIVPGIALIHWARQQAERHFNDHWRDMKRVRFPTALLPGDRATMTLARDERGLSVGVASHRGEHLQLRMLPVTSTSRVSHE